MLFSLHQYSITRFVQLLIGFQLLCRPKLSPGSVESYIQGFGPSFSESNITSEAYKKEVVQAKQHILAGDIFQNGFSQQFERRTFADPFEVYRAFRVVNPSPFMTYLQVCVCSSINYRTTLKRFLLSFGFVIFHIYLICQSG